MDRNAFKKVEVPDKTEGFALLPLHPISSLHGHTLSIQFRRSAYCGLGWGGKKSGGKPPHPKNERRPGEPGRRCWKQRL